MRLAAVLLLLALAGCAQAPLPPASPGAPSGAGIALQLLAQGLSAPLYVAQHGDARLYIVEQGGLVKVWDHGALLPEPFLDVRDRVTTGGERGLLSIAFDPQAARVWADYTDLQGDSVVAWYPWSGASADASQEHAVLHVPQPYPNHNGGLALFGPDGMLYIGFGDGGSGGDPHGNGQSLSTLLGKLLRVDVRNGTLQVPAGNPFAGRDCCRGEIWSYGLRNPWRFSFDRATRELYIADVGQDRWEEVDHQAADDAGGEDYGWNAYEASHVYRQQATGPLVMPVWEYDHGEGRCSVTGGYVYRGDAIPALRGTYLFGDYCSGQVWGLVHDSSGWHARELLRTGFRISSFGEEADGELDVVDHGGRVFRVVPG
jgi:glucose/arabinose dehydrogenase